MFKALKYYGRHCSWRTTRFAKLVCFILSLTGYPADARPLPKAGDDFFQYLASYMDYSEELRDYVIERLKVVTPENDPKEWVRLYAFYRISLEGDEIGDVLHLDSKINLAIELSKKFEFYPEYLSFFVTTIQEGQNGLPKDWQTTFDGIVSTAKATGDHRALAEIYRVYSTMMTYESIENGAALAQKALEESLLDVRKDDILPYTIKSKIAIFMQTVGNDQEAKIHLQDVLAFCRQANIRQFGIKTARNLAKLLIKDGKPASLLQAEKYYKEALTVAKSLKEQEYIAEVETGLANLYLIQKNQKGVHKYLGSLRPRLVTLNYSDYWAEFYRIEAELFLQEGHPDTALQSIDLALGETGKENLQKYSLILKTKIDILSKMKLSNDLVTVVNEYVSTLDNLEKQKHNKDIPQLQAKMGLGLEQQKSALLQRENELQQQTLKAAQAENRLKNWLISTAFLMAILAAIGLIILRRKNNEIHQLNGYIKNQVLQRFLPPQIVAEVMSGRSQLDDHPHTQLTTVLFADLVGFTKVTDQMDSDRVARVLNSFMSRMTDLIFEERGTIDKFIGDAIMVVFGAPSQMEAQEQAQRAISCARAMQSLLEKLNLDWEKQDGCHFEMRIGIHQGPAIVGSFGNEKRSDYTVIGRTVNIASRIENRAEPGEILFSEILARQLTESTFDKGVFTLRGIEQPMRLFTLPQPMATQHSA